MQDEAICIIINFDILYNLRKIFRVQIGRESEKINKEGGVPMSFEAITSVMAAEAEAKASVAAAEAKARQLLADAETEGKAAVEAAAAKAESELRELRRRTEEKAGIESRELTETLEGRQAQLRAQAEPRLEEAAALIVERIVND